MSEPGAAASKAIDKELNSPEPGWEELTLHDFIKSSYDFVSGEPGGRRIRVRYYKRSSDGALVGKVWFGPMCSGPPGYAHGGAAAAVLDESMGFAAWVAGHGCVGARITTTYRNLLPLGTVAQIEARVVDLKGSKVSLKSLLSGGDGTVFVEAKGLFLELPHDKWVEIAKAPGG